MELSGNRFKVAGVLAKARLGSRTPLKVTHLLTYRCNVECGFCTRIHVPSGHMREEQVIQRVVKGADLSVHNMRAIARMYDMSASYKTASKTTNRKSFVTALLKKLA